MKYKILKSLTFIGFFSLIAVFVAYRSGKINNPISVSPNGGNINLTKENPKDTAAMKKRTMISSSKSVIVTDFELDFDTTKQYTREDSQRIRRFQIMSSSKSMPIVEPTIKFDTVKIQQQKQK
jgi:hypothetical protein